MPTKITYDQLAEAKDLKRLNDDLMRVGENIKKIKSNLTNIKKADSAGIKQVNKSTKQLSEEEKKLIEIQKSQASLEKQRQREKKKYNMQLAKQEAKERELTRAMNMEVRSLNDLMKKNNALVAARKRVNLTTEEGRKKYMELTRQIKTNNDSLKKYDAQIGNHQRNVGNYSSALEGIPGPMGRVVNSVKMFGQALKALGKIPILLFITALVGALAGLAKIFISTDDGGTKLEATMNGLKAVFAIVKRVILDFASNIGNAFKIVGAGAQKLWAKITGNTERVQEMDQKIAELKGTIDKNKPFENLGEKALGAYDRVRQLTFQMDELNDRMIAAISEQKELEFQMEKYMKLANDQTLTDKQRLRYYEIALAKTKKFYGLQRDFAEDQFKNEIEMEAERRVISAETLEAFIKMGHKEAEQARKTNAKINEFWNDAGDKRVEELENFYVKMLEADTNYERKARRIFSQLTGFRKKIQAAELKQQELTSEKKLQENQEFIESIYDQFEDFAEQVNEDIEKIEMYGDDEKEEDLQRIKEAGQQIQDAINERFQNIKEVRKNYGLFSDEEYLREERNELRRAYEAGEIDYTTYQDALTAIQEREQQKRLQQTREETRAIGQALTETVNQIGNALSQVNALQAQKIQDQVDAKEKEIDRLKSLLEEEVEAQENKDANSVASLQRRINQEETLRNQSLQKLEETRKREAQIQLLSQASSITTAVAKAIEGFQTIPIAGVALGIAAAASIIAAFASYKQQVQSEVDSFAEGVIDYKGKGTEKSDSNTVRISNRESVITAEGTKKAPKTLDLINKGMISDKDIIDSKFFTNREMFSLNFRGYSDGLSRKLDENIEETKKLRKFLENKPDYVSFKPGTIFKMKGYSKEIIRE
jgi:hypothetical protein